MAQGRDAAYATASKVMVDNLALRDGQEGIQAFLEKRKPVWSHKAEKAHDWTKLSEAMPFINEWQEQNPLSRAELNSAATKVILQHDKDPRSK